MDTGIRVRALRTGFIGSQLKAGGSEFTLLKLELFSPLWMEKIPFPKSEGDTELEDTPDVEPVKSRKK